MSTETKKRVDWVPEIWYEIISKDHFWFIWRLRAFLNLLKKMEVQRETPLKVLEVGCGSGVLANQIEAQTQWTVDGIDINPTALALAKPGRGRLFFHDLTQPIPEMIGQYDLVLVFDVIEHVQEPSQFLNYVTPYLKPGGWMVINVPANERLRSKYDSVVGHLRRYSIDRLMGELSLVKGLVLRPLHAYWGAFLLPLTYLRRLVLSFESDPTEVVRKGFDPPARFINRMLAWLSWLERPWINRIFKGTSLMTAIQKEKT